MTSLKEIKFDQTRTTDIFISYARNDESKVKDWSSALNSLIVQYRFNIFVDKNIQTGDDWNEAIINRINEASLIVYFFSHAFLGSSYIDKNEANFLTSTEKIKFVIYLSDCKPKPEYKHLQYFTAEINGKNYDKYDDCKKSQQASFQSQAVSEIQKLLTQLSKTL